MQLHIWRVGKFISPDDVDGWMMALNNCPGIMLAPPRAIFVVGFGDDFLGADEGAMPLGR
jgi:hypothetical protein